MGWVMPVVMGAMSMMSSMNKSNEANAQAKYQQSQMEANAQAARSQAKITAQRGRVEAENIDSDKQALTRQFADAQSGAVANLGALGVDMSSGSAANVLQGNANAYAEDVGQNRYQKAFSQWETRQNVNAQLTTAKNYDNAASYYASTVKSLGQSLLTGGMSGMATGLGAYSSMGGSFSSLFGGGSKSVTSGSSGSGFSLYSGNAMQAVRR